MPAEISEWPENFAGRLSQNWSIFLPSQNRTLPQTPNHGDNIMANRSRLRSAACVALALSLALVGTTGAKAAVLTTNFSDSAGLGYGTGTTQTIAQNGIRLQALQQMYEVTFYPEVNLKDFAGDGSTREILIDREAGGYFDFVGFSIRDVTNNLLTVTSDQGGVFVVPSGFQSFAFSGPQWETLSWVRFTYTGQYTEAKITSFSLNTVDVVSDELTSWSRVKLLFQ
jgi:hypothetical protein